MAYILKLLGSSKRSICMTLIVATQPGKFDSKFPYKDGKLRKMIDKFEAKHARLQRNDYNEWNYASLEDVKNAFDSYSLTEQAVFVKGDVCKTLKNQSNLPASGISLPRLIPISTKVQK